MSNNHPLSLPHIASNLLFEFDFQDLRARLEADVGYSCNQSKTAVRPLPREPVLFAGVFPPSPASLIALTFRQGRETKDISAPLGACLLDGGQAAAVPASPLPNPTPQAPS
ncbi:hypothetical protein FS842_007362 [Serendipita sp. 407]|nr:hypothetical protein FS842_007362 [Serendipita sp. 407]